MFDIAERLDGYDAPSARELLYYLARYFKQSHSLLEDGKDTFDDVFDRSPSAEVRKETKEIALEIEASVGQKAVEFDDEMVEKVLDEITRLEEALDERFSDDELKEASSIIGTMGKSNGTS